MASRTIKGSGRRFAALAAWLCLGVGVAEAQRTVYVNGQTGDDDWDGLCEEWDGGTCGPKATIQAGIDIALTDDEVRVADGLYTGLKNRDLDFWGKAITVHSASGDPNACIIDCESSGRGFRFHSGETPASVVQGFTITNGDVEDYGGGVYCGYASSPTIMDCTITSSDAMCGGGLACTSGSAPTLNNCTIIANTADDYGGGIYCYDHSSPTLTNCTVTGNTAQSGGGVYCNGHSSPTLTECLVTGNAANIGGGIHCHYFASPTLTHCTITENTAATGGGVSCQYYAGAMLANCTITGNTASTYGGGVHCYEYGSATLIDCAITANVSSLNGGGIYCHLESSPALTNCKLAANRAHIDGGGLYCEWESAPTIVNCLFVGNTAFEDGGAIACISSNPSFVNCVLSANLAQTHGGAVYCVFDSSPTFHNCIMWDDEPDEIYLSTGNPVVTYTDIEGWWPGDGNINVDPLFVSLPDDGGDGWGDDPNTPGIDEGANDDFGDLRLQPGSPCIDAADNMAVPADTFDLDGDGDPNEPIPFDLAGRSRFIDDPNTPDSGNGTPPIVDMGAYEVQLLGDLNCDDEVDFGDINPFVLALTDPAGYETQYPDCDIMNGDTNSDGVVDFGDINPFVALLLQ